MCRRRGFPSRTSPVRIRSAAPKFQGVTGQPVAPSALRVAKWAPSEERCSGRNERPTTGRGQSRARTRTVITRGQARQIAAYFSRQTGQEGKIRAVLGWDEITARKPVIYSARPIRLGNLGLLFEV